MKFLDKLTEQEKEELHSQLHNLLNQLKEHNADLQEFMIWFENETP